MFRIATAVYMVLIIASVAHSATISLDFNGDLETSNDARYTKIKAAFSVAAKEWGAVISDDIHIRVFATAYSFTPVTSTLAHAGPTLYTVSLNGNPNFTYPSALASMLDGVDYVPGPGHQYADFHMQIAVNADHLDKLYLELDGNAAAFRQNNPSSPIAYDIVSILLHEMGHGLGFLSTVNKTTGGWTQLGVPDVFSGYLYWNAFDLDVYYDFAYMTDGNRYTAMTSNDLWWDSPQVRASVQPGPGVQEDQGLTAGPAIAPLKRCWRVVMHDSSKRRPAHAHSQVCPLLPGRIRGNGRPCPRHHPNQGRWNGIIQGTGYLPYLRMPQRGFVTKPKVGPPKVTYLGSSMACSPTPTGLRHEL